MASACNISGADEHIFVMFGSGFVFKFTDNRRNRERTLLENCSCFCVYFLHKYVLGKNYWYCIMLQH